MNLSSSFVPYVDTAPIGHPNGCVPCGRGGLRLLRSAQPRGGVRPSHPVPAATLNEWR